MYSEGRIHEGPSQDVVALVAFLRVHGVVEVLDAGCGTGRHSNFLCSQGFNVHGIDISEEAIRIARTDDETASVDYRVSSVVKLPFPPNSMDFVLASHSLEYAPDEDIQGSVAKLDSTLRKGGFILIRVVSTKHIFFGVSPEEVYGFSSVSFCLKNGLPVHFFTEDELRILFSNYDITRLEHRAKRIGIHKKITVPLAEWILFGRKI